MFLRKGSWQGLSRGEMPDLPCQSGLQAQESMMLVHSILGPSPPPDFGDDALLPLLE